MNIHTRAVVCDMGLSIHRNLSHLHALLMNLHLGVAKQYKKDYVLRLSVCLFCLLTCALSSRYVYVCGI